MWNWLEYLIYGTASRPLGSPPPPAITPLQEVALSHRSSQVFDSHVLTEAAANPQAVSLAWDEGRAYGFNTAPQSWMGMTPRERKETLLSIFLANPWASNCVDTIALYITSGGYTIEPRVEKPDERQREEIEQFLRRINEDWDFNQYTYDQITDEDIFGECFTEFTMKNGKPYQLFPIDCLTMDTEHDRYGRVTKYKQQLSSTSVTNDLDPKTIVRWWNPHKRAKVDPFSPLERIQDAILLDKKMTNWMTTFFQKGAKFPYSLEGFGDQDEADRFLTWHRANHTGEKNAQTPVALWGNAKLVPAAKGSIDMDFDKGLDRMQTIVLSAFHVPPSIACIAESGNRLTDMSDSQRKILEYIACDPRRHRFFEKFNYRLIHPFFGSDYYVSSRYADFRSDAELAKMQDTRIRNGSTTINETRQEMGKKAYAKGGDIALFAVSREVTPVERLDEMADEQRQIAQTALDAADLNNQLLQTKVDQAKEPPPAPIQPVGQNGTPVQQSGSTNKTGQDDEKDTQGQAKANTGQQKKSGKTAGAESHTNGEGNTDLINGSALTTLIHRQPGDEKASGRRSASLSLESPNGRGEAGQHTGMMLAFLLDAETAQELALPDGEPASELHITLAYLGDREEQPEDDLLRPHTSPEQIKAAIASIAHDVSPLYGHVAGLGRFQPVEAEETPVIALVDVPGLVELRIKFVNWIQECGYFVADNHGYTPHITLAYIDQDAPMPVETVPALALTFDTVWLCIGEERIPFKFGEEPSPIGEDHDRQNKPQAQGNEKEVLANAQEAANRGSNPQQPAPRSDAQRCAADVGTAQDMGRIVLSFSDKNSTKRVEESHEKQATHSQSDTGNAFIQRSDQDQGDASLSLLQEAVNKSHTNGSAGSESGQRTSVADQQKAALADWIAALFAGMKQRGNASSPTRTTALTVYALSHEEQEELAHKLAEVYQAAQRFAYIRDMQAVGLTPHIEESLSSRVGDLISWGRAQVSSIVSTFQNLFSSFLGGLPADTPDVIAPVDGWMDRYGAYKSEQIANVAWGTGANNGTMTAIEDVLDPDQTQKYPVSGRVRVRVIPGYGSSDQCQYYAGNDYSIEEYQALGVRFPLHIACIHSIELFVGEGEDA